MLDGLNVRSNGFVSVRRPQKQKVGRGTTNCKLFHWLMRRTVLAETNRIMGENVKNTQVSDGRERNSSQLQKTNIGQKTKTAP